MTMTNLDFTRPWIVYMILTSEPDGKLPETMCTNDDRWVFRIGGLVMLDANGDPPAMPRSRRSNCNRG